MFKRGDLLISERRDDCVVVISDEAEGCRLQYDDGSGGSSLTRDFVEKRYTPYTGPPYQVDGKRFVASGEFRAPKEGEWFRRESGSQFVGGPMIAQRNETEYRAILLPVPELPEEDPGPCMCCNGTGEVSSKCRRCGGSGNE